MITYALTTTFSQFLIISYQSLTLNAACARLYYPDWVWTLFSNRLEYECMLNYNTPWQNVADYIHAWGVSNETTATKAYKLNRNYTLYEESRRRIPRQKLVHVNIDNIINVVLLKSMIHFPSTVISLPSTGYLQILMHEYIWRNISKSRT